MANVANRVRLSDIFGRIELKQTMRYEDGRIIFGYQHIKYDGQNNIIKIDEVDTGLVGYKNRPMSQIEAAFLMECRRD